MFSFVSPDANCVEYNIGMLQFCTIIHQMAMAADRTVVRCNSPYLEVRIDAACGLATDEL
jgi:hypothetical protein